MPHRIPRFLWRNLAVVVLVSATVVDTYLFIQARDQAHKSRTLAAANHDRIVDIQHARIESCKFTYEGIRQVFKPFFRTKTVRTAKEQRDVDRFNNTVNKLKAGCDRQTGVQP